jgi:hypothetical protein
MLSVMRSVIGVTLIFAVACEVRAQPISLIVSAPPGAQPQFSPDLFTGIPGESILLNATIINVSQSPVTVAAKAHGVIAVEAIWIAPLRRDPERPRPALQLVPAQRAVFFYLDPNILASRALVTLSPQERIQFPILAVEKLNLVPGQPYTKMIYTPPGPGEYIFRFSYTYAGPDDNGGSPFPNVYHGTVTSPMMSVRVE